MITFESVGDYPNGYELTNDELAAIHEVASKDWSINYTVREKWERLDDAYRTQVYHLEMFGMDEGERVGPCYRIEPDGDWSVLRKSRIRIIKDEEDGDTVFEVVGADPLNQTNAVTFAQAIELANEWAPS